MSTQYLFVNTELSDKIQVFQRQLATLKAEYLTKIQQIPVDKDLEDVRDRFIEQVSSAHIFEIDEPEDTRIVIGTARAARFQWRYENGFCDLSTVKRWMERWPKFSIVDEYGTAVSLEEFTGISGRVHRYHQAIS